jgi:hypothetical protein
MYVVEGSVCVSNTATVPVANFVHYTKGRISV